MAFASSLEARVSPSLNAYAKNSAALGDISIRLGTGLRIIRNGDDSTSISAAAALQSQTAGLRGALGGSARATSFLQIAYDGLDQIRSLVESMRTLTDTATGSGVTPMQYATLDAQFQNAFNAINTVAAATTFDGASILDGSAAPKVVISTASGDNFALTIPDMRTSSLFGGAANIASLAAATTSSTKVTSAGDAVDTALAKIDAYQQRLVVANAAVRSDIGGLGSAVDGLLATNRASETRDATALTLRQDTAAAILAQALGINHDLLHLLR